MLQFSSQKLEQNAKLLNNHSNGVLNDNIDAYAHAHDPIISPHVFIHFITHTRKTITGPN